MLNFKKMTKSLKNNEDGAVAIIVAVSLVVLLFGILSLSIDLNRTQTSYTHNYNGTDAAALAGAEMWLNAKVDAIGEQENPLDFRPSEDAMTEFTKEIMRSNFAQDQGSSIFLENSSFSATMSEETVGSGKTRYSVNVYACGELNTPIASVANHNQDQENPGKGKTCTTSTAAFDLGTLENTEVAFALDFTSSMYWRGANQGCPPNSVGGGTNSECPTFVETKAYALQQAVSYALDNYFNESADGTAFASIVPYTSFVNVWPYHNNGVVNQSAASDQIDFDGKSLTFGGYDADSRTFPSTSVFSTYRPMQIVKTDGEDMHSYRDVGYKYMPFYTYESSDDRDDDTFETRNYSSILNRIPVIDSAEYLDRIIGNPSNTSFLPFENYYEHVENISKSSSVFQPELSALTSFSNDPTSQYAKMVCYQLSVAAAADERIDGELISSTYAESKQGGRRIELHESFPIQPLTNDYDVLNNILERYVANTRLDGSGSFPSDSIIDFQSKRIDKARLSSLHHKTSSIHGLMWAWFTINNAWQDVWDEDSLHEDYKGGSKSVRDGSSGDALPSPNNFKHIILISDGFDNDGCEDRTGGSASEIINVPVGRINVCDSYTPLEQITDTQYNNLCTTIKQGDPENNKDDTAIHIITLDFDAEVESTNDINCTKAKGVNNRYRRCATEGEYYNNVAPSALEDAFDNIFAGILTKAVPVRLIK